MALFILKIRILILLQYNRKKETSNSSRSYLIPKTNINILNPLLKVTCGGHNPVIFEDVNK